MPGLMRRLVAFLMFLVVQAGCEGRSVKEDFPIFGPAPPRISTSDDALFGPDLPIAAGGATSSSADLRVRQTAFEEGNALDPNLTGSEVVATVNGIPIFSGDVLERYGHRIDLAREKYSEAEFQQLRRELIKRHLQDTIDREVLVQALKATLKKEQLDSVQEQLAQAFDGVVLANLKKEIGVSTRHEVELELQRQGTSLLTLQDSFINRQMAGTYLASRTKTADEVGREEILGYYRANIAEYTTPDELRWQQIVVQADKHDGPDGARAWMQKAVDELRSGAAFDEVARKYSDGPTAKSGGRWDWTQRGSLADSELEDVLFSLPVGATRMLVKQDRYVMAKVTDLHQAGRKSFESVQGEIETKLKRQRRDQESERVLEEIRAAAQITMIFE